MRLENLHSIFFIGIGGIGMSALARFFLDKGVKVAGYDRASNVNTSHLEQLGASICYDDSLSHIPDDVDLFIYTPAIPREHKQLAYAISNNLPIMKRARVLGFLAHGKPTVAVAGTHGKTTASSIISHILKEADFDFKAFLGGISKNYQSNYIASGKQTTVVAEADEYDKSFLNLFPDIAVVTALDPDHLDIYGTHKKMIDAYNEFLGQLKENGNVLINHKHLKHIGTENVNVNTYGIDGHGDFSADNIRIKDGAYIFDIYRDGELLLGDMQLNYGGKHNIENTVAAVSVCILLGVSAPNISKAVGSYTGVCRRFDVRIKQDKLVYIDDYAHHPDELRVLISSVREFYPQKKILGIFQPHLYSRTRDFADAFAEILQTLDELILLDIYPAREKPIKGVNSQMLLDKVQLENKKICDKNELVDVVMQSTSEVILSIGAGDIDTLVEPLEKALKRNKRQTKQ